MVNRPVPVLKDQMVVSGKRFIESENGAIQNASICAARELIDLFIILSPLIVSAFRQACQPSRLAEKLAGWLCRPARLMQIGNECTDVLQYFGFV